MEEHRKLYDWFLAQGHIGDDTSFEDFYDGFKDIENVKGIYGFIKGQNATEQTIDQFGSKYFVKKKDSPQDSGSDSVTQEQPGAAANGQGNFSPIEFDRSVGVQTDNTVTPDRGLRYDPVAELTLTGKEDISQYQESIRAKNEGEAYGSRLAVDRSKDLRREAREADNTIKYGQTAINQVKYADGRLKSMFGENWENELSSLTTELNQGAIATREAEIRNRISDITQNEWYQKYAAGAEAAANAEAKYYLHVNNGALAAYKKEQERRQQIADQNYQDSYWKPARDFVLRKGMNTLGSILTAPRTFGTAISGGSSQVTVADAIGAFGDDVFAMSEMNFPKPSSLQVATFEDVVDFNGQKVVLDNSGQPSQIIKDGKRYKATPEFAAEYAASPDEKKVRVSYTGNKPLLDKVAESAADLFLMRYAGGGTTAGTMASSVVISHNGLYQEAIAAGMSADQAAEYAATGALMTGAIEGYVGGFEAKLFKPFATTATKTMTKSAAKLVAEGMSPGQAAWNGLKMVMKETGGEVKEEVIQAMAEDYNRKVFTSSIAPLEDQMNTKSLGETVLATTLLTAPLAALGIKGYNTSARKSAMLSAINNPDQFSAALDGLVTDGVITREKADKTVEKVARLRVYNESLPDGLSLDDRADLLAKQDYADDKTEEAQDEAQMPAARDVARKAATDTKKEIENTIRVATGVPLEENAEGAPVAAVPEEATPDVPVTTPVAEPTVTEAGPEVFAEKVAAFAKERNFVVAPQRVEEAFQNIPPDTPVDTAAFQFVNENTPPVDFSLPEYNGEPDFVQQAMTDYVASGGQISDTNRAVSQQASSAWFNPDAPSITEIATDISRNTGIPISEAQAQVERFVQQNPERLATVATERAAIAQVAEVAALDGDEITVTPEDAREAVAYVAPEIQAISQDPDTAAQVAEQYNNDPVLIADAIEAGEINIPQNAAVQGIQEGQSPVMAPAQPGEEIAGQAPAIARKVQSSETPDDQTGLDRGGPVVEPLRIDNINSPEVAGGAIEQGVDPADAVVRAAGDIGLPVGPALPRQNIQEHTERQVREAVDAINQQMATDGPAVIYSGDDIVVVNADGLQDAMSDAGGRYEYGRGWVFPKDAEPAVRAAMANQSPSYTDRQQFAQGGSSGRLAASVRDKFVAAANAMRKRRIRKAKTIDEAMDIVAEDGNVAAEGVRDARVQHVTEMLRKAFPGIQVVTDPAVIDEMAMPGQPAGFVKDGVVYIDMRRAGPDTAMHEFGHVWMMAAKGTELYQMGIDSVVGSEYEKTIREDPRYASLSDQEIQEEALALAIGERGARIVSRTRWEKFSAFLSAIADYFKYKIGAGVDPMNMSAADFADVISHQIMKGGDYTSAEIARVQGDMVKFQYDAQNAQQDQDIARKMRIEGVDLTGIRAITGWTIGADGRWEWRPMDSEVAPDVRMALDGEVIDLSDLIFNGPLFKADPEIQKMKVLFSSAVDAPQIGVQAGGVFLIMPVGSNKDNVTEPVRRLVTNLSKIRKGMGINVLIAPSVDQAADAFASDTDVALKNLVQSWRNMGLAQPGMMSEDELQAVLDKVVFAWRGMNMAEVGMAFGQQQTDQVPVSPSTEAALGGAARDFVPGFDDFSEQGRYDAEKDALRKAAVRQGATLIIEKAIRQGAGQGLITADTNTTSKEAMANKLFDRFGIDHSWSYSEWDRIASQQPGGKRFFDTAGIKKAVEKAGVWWQKNLVYRGQLPKDIYDLNRRRGGEVNALLSSMDSLASQLETAMKKEFGMLTAENRALVDSILKGDTHINAVSPELGELITNMRAFVDNLSIRILRAGGLTKHTIIKIIDGVGIPVYDQSGDILDDVNDIVGVLSTPPYDRTPQENEMIDDFLRSHSGRFGTYLNRSYRVHDFPDWKDRIAPDVMRDAEIYIQAELQREADEIAQGLAEYEDAVIRRKAELDKRAADLVAQVEADLAAATEPADITRLTDVLAEMNEILSAVEGTPQYRAVVLDPATTKGVARAVTMLRAARRASYKLDQQLKRARPEAVERLTALHGRIKNIKGEINRILDYDAPMANVSNKGVLGAKDRGVLQRREDLAPEIRALLGEYTDPVVNFSKSIFKMAHLAANTEFLNSMRKRYEGVYFFEQPGVNNENWKQFGSTGNANLAPLAGWYTTPEIYDAMTEFYEPAQMDWWQRLWITQFVQMVKLGKTVLSPETHPRNFFGNAMFHVVHGWNPANATDTVKTWANRNSNPEAWRQTKEKYYRLGIFGESVSANDMKEIMTDIEDRFTRNKFDSTGGAVTNAVASAGRFVFNKAKKLYEAEDEVHRIMAFENEAARYSKALYGRPISELSPEQRTAVEERAADIVSHIMPTASFVPRLLKHIRRFPFTGTFVTFPAEMIRVTWNTVDLAKTEMKDPRTRGIGVRRLVGLTTAVAGMQALTLALRAAFGYDDEYWEAINYFQPEYAKYSQLVPVGPNEKGQARWWNASYTNPFSFINKSWNAVLMNDNHGTGIVHAVDAFFDPFISPELTFNTMDLLIRNKDDRYEDIRVESLKDPIFGTSFFHPENLRRSLAYAGKKLSPGIVKSGMDAWNIAFDESDGSGRSKTWATYATSHLLGARIENFDPTVSANAKASAAYAQKQAAMGIYKDVQYKMNRAWKNMHNEATEPTKAREDNFHREAIEELNRAYEVSMEAYISVIQEAHKLYQHGIKVGITPSEMSSIFKDRHFSDENGEIQAIVSGNTSYLRLRFKKKDRY